MHQIMIILDKYTFKYKYYEGFNIIKIDFKDIEKRFADIKRVLKILTYKAQYKQIKKNTLVLEILEKDILSDNIFILLDTIKITKTLHYFNIKVKKGIELNLTNQVIDRLKLLIEKYQGLTISN